MTINKVAKLYGETLEWWLAAIHFYEAMVGPAKVTVDAIQQVFQHRDDALAASYVLQALDLHLALSDLQDYWYAHRPTAALLFGEHA